MSTYYVLAITTSLSLQISTMNSGNKGEPPQLQVLKKIFFINLRMLGGGRGKRETSVGYLSYMSQPGIGTHNPDMCSD